MTDKQIIDGKECRYWFRGPHDDYRRCSLRGKNDNCDEINDCFIKELLGKLVLKEQECEELRIDIKDIANLLDLDTVEEYSFSNIELEIKELKQQLDQLKAENENLKRQHQGDKGLITSTGKMNYQLLQEYDKLKNCLTEIKEIAEKRNYLDYNECLDDILQKINECEVRNERN